MTEFWGYLYADVLAFVIISTISLAALLCARIFVKTY
jgi:hypothetical protein